MIVTAIVLAVAAAFFDWWIGIKEPWRKLIFAGIVVLLVVGIVMLIFPGILPVHIHWY